MKMEEYFRDIGRLLDESMKLIDRTIEESKGEKKEMYTDYRKDLREMGAMLYRLIGKMRMDRVFNPEAAGILLSIISVQPGE